MLIKKIEKFKKKDKALMATWSDLDESKTDSEVNSDDEEDDSSICLMAQSEVNSEPDYTSDDDVIAEMKKLLKALKKADAKINKLNSEVKFLKNEKEALFQTNKLLADENDILKYDNENLHVNMDKFKKENSLLKEETKELNKRIDDLSQSLKNTFSKFNESDKKLNMLISFQRTDKGKYGLGFEQGSTSKNVQKTVFVKGKEPLYREATIVNNSVIKKKSVSPV